MVVKKLIIMENKPYKDNKNGNIINRVFNANVNETELTWHRDHEDRIVKVLNENDWKLQFDNDLPIELTKNSEYLIPKNTFHRVIKGSTKLMVEITETEMIDEKMVLSNYDDYSKIVAQAYINAPDFDQSVVPSYKALMDSTKKLYKQMLSKLKVEFVDYDPYESRDQMNKDLNETGVLKISKLFNEHPLYTKEENLILRAVHDYYTHIISNQDFGLRGELKAYNTHAKLAPPAALPALFSEIVGQVCYAIVHGDFTKQKICKLDGFDFKNVGRIENIDIINKQLKLDNQENLNVTENFSIFDKNYITMRLHETLNLNNAEPMIEPQVKPMVQPNPNEVKPSILPSRRNKPYIIEPDKLPKTDPKANK